VLLRTVEKRLTGRATLAAPTPTPTPAE